MTEVFDVRNMRVCYDFPRLRGIALSDMDTGPFSQFLYLRRDRVVSYQAGRASNTSVNTMICNHFIIMALASHLSPSLEAGTVNQIRGYF